MQVGSPGRRRVLKYGLVAGSLFTPLPFAWVRAQSEGTLKLLRAPKFALVIGNGNYRNAPALRNPANDASAIAKVLKEFGFDVALGLDAGKAAMEAAIEDHTLRLADGRGVGLFYYAGHGLQLSWTNFLVPVEASVRKAEDVAASCVDLGFLMGNVRKAANPMNVIILDACRENPFERDFRVSGKGLTQMDAPNDTLLAYATAPGNVASDGAGENGLYTENLLREMRVPETRVEDVFKRVRLHVRRRTSGAQVPWESTSLEEDFWFIPPKAMGKTSQAPARKLLATALRAHPASFFIGQAHAQDKGIDERRARAEAMARLDREAQQRAAAAEADRKARAEERARREREALASPETAKAFHEELSRWERIKDSRNPEDFYSFLLERPSGYVAELAQFRLDQLEKPVVQPEPGADGIRQLPSGVPRYAVGDTFEADYIDRYTKISRRLRLKITRADDRIAEGNGGTIIYDQMGGILRDQIGVKNPANMLTPSNMAVGKRWQSAFSDTHHDGYYIDVFWNYRVTGIEDITVPAGTVKCFRMEGEGYSQNRIGVANLKMQRWVDPATMDGIRIDREYRYSSGRAFEYSTTVLVSAKRVPR